MTEIKREDSRHRSSTKCRIPRLSRPPSVILKEDQELTGDGSYPPDCRDYALTPLPFHRGSSDKPGDFDSMCLLSVNRAASEDDQSSVKSYGSYASYMSCDVRSHTNGTDVSLTRHKSQLKKYVLHCERQMTPYNEYLTPTQRKDKEIRHLRTSLIQTNRVCDEKESEIRRLKSQLEQFHIAEDLAARLLKEKDSRNSSSKDPLVQHAGSTEKVFRDGYVQTSYPVSGALDHIKGSSTESMNVEQGNGSNIVSAKCNGAGTQLDDSEKNIYDKSRECQHANTIQNDTQEDKQLNSTYVTLPLYVSIQESIISGFHNELEELKRKHNNSYEELTEKFNKRIEELVFKLGEANSRYQELRPLYEKSQDKMQHLESQIADVQREMASQEEWHSQMYLKMYRKGQEAAMLEQIDGSVDGNQRTPKVSVSELLIQLRQLEEELEQTKQLYREASRAASGDRQAEYTLRFLKDAVYYYLTKKDKEHLKAIQSILGFSDAERLAVTKSLKHKRF